MSLGVFPIGIDPDHVSKTLKIPWVQVSIHYNTVWITNYYISMFANVASRRHSTCLAASAQLQLMSKQSKWYYDLLIQCPLYLCFLFVAYVVGCILCNRAV
jgi:hypothetical protein